MKNLLIWYLPQAAALLIISSAHAQFYSGNELHTLCSGNRTIALGFVSGVYDSSKALELADNSPKVKICMPQGVTNGQVLDIVCQRLRDKPGNRHLGAFWLSYQAMQDAFPCRDPR